MAEGSDSPPRPLPLALQQTKPPSRFLPLAENIMSPRNQALPSLLHSRTFVASESPRRWSVYGRDNEETEYGTSPRRGLTGDALGPAQRSDSFMQRKDSLANLVPGSMLTEEMRSMRLIGNSNPRYQW